MSAITKEPVIPSPIENTTTLMGFVDGVARRYEITPNNGYVLHDNAMDWMENNPETLEGTLKLGYTTGTCTCIASYDFAANPREFYAVPASSVPADQIFGVGEPNHEVM